jgi:LPXTG-site transpeptidase (sortase) family protein
MRLHNRGRAVTRRLIAIFLVTFVGAFALLNIRFVEKNVQYWAAPSTIRSRDSLGDAIRLLPLAQSVSEQPLPDTARLVIDTIGVDAPLVFNTPNDNDLIYGNLENGVVHYTNTAKPGNPGTALVLGHSSAFPWYKGDYGAVFALLSKLQQGDRFYVQYEDGRSFFYEMQTAVVFNPFSDAERIAKLEAQPGSGIILISCFPVGTNYKRIAVYARQIEI